MGNSKSKEVNPLLEQKEDEEVNQAVYHEYEQVNTFLRKEDDDPGMDEQMLEEYEELDFQTSAQRFWRDGSLQVERCEAPRPMEGTRAKEMVKEVKDLLDLFIEKPYKAKNVDPRYETIHKYCFDMASKDYKVDTICNKMGELCANYPSQLIIIERELESGNTDDPGTNVNDVSKLKGLMVSSHFARCRSRFVVPVILFENKNICRSSTLSSAAELYGRSGLEWVTSQCFECVDAAEDTDGHGSTPPVISTDTHTKSGWTLLDDVRNRDVQLLNALGVTLISDLMVEKQKLKYGFFVSSSEKVEEWRRYSTAFRIASMPYPGCEFFIDYRDNGHNGEGLKFDWKQSFIDAQLQVPKELEGAVDMAYADYKNWDLIEITQNYMKMLLQYLVQSDGGMLVHCISGWDRTPLFISLLRLSLWADGKVHKSLSPAEMLYFTLAFDWLMYGHQLKMRHDKGEEVLYFCFDFLKYIVTKDFSVTRVYSDAATEASASTKREKQLNEVRELFIQSFQASAKM